jgi:hypothetical protein
MLSPAKLYQCARLIYAVNVLYYRIHSPIVLIEFDHQRPANLRGTGSNQPPRQDDIHNGGPHPNGTD